MIKQGVGMTAYMIMADPEATFEFLKKYDNYSSFGK